jgi:hypothetical protein
LDVLYKSVHGRYRYMSKIEFSGLESACRVHERALASTVLEGSLRVHLEDLRMLIEAVSMPLEVVRLL